MNHKGLPIKELLLKKDINDFGFLNKYSTKDLLKANEDCFLKKFNLEGILEHKDIGYQNGWILNIYSICEYILDICFFSMIGVAILFVIIIIAVSIDLSHLPEQL